jgi:hypothetical protein
MEELTKLENQLQEIEEKKKIALENQQYTYMALLRDQEREIQEKISDLIVKNND